MIIYKITNIFTGKIYIGQTKGSLENRWKKHIQAARYKLKSKTAIIGAIKKYGSDNFKIEQIDVADNKDELDIKEEFFASMLNAYAPVGYNLDGCGKLRTKNSETKERQKKEYTFVSPENIVIKIRNLFKFSEENGLDHCHMYKVAMGKRQSHKGWRTIKNTNKIYILWNKELNISYELISAYGYNEIFCKKYNMGDSFISQLIHGRVKSANGWVIKEIKII
jgi:group I intron endonuclease